MSNHPNRGRGRPREPDAAKTLGFRIRPSLEARMRATGPGWMTRAVAVLEAAFPEV